LLLLDEPLNNVDVRTQARIFDSLDQLALEGKALLVSTHDLGTLRTEFSRAAFIDRTILADGPVTDTINPELIAHAYGISPHVCPPELLELWR
ncbi:MAG: manganese ABC transporter ATP-binding protein, partial [Ardenticatenaceae bacterium]